MGVRILYDERNDQACMYCSTSDWAFGPVTYGEDAREKLEAFCIWLPDDPRGYSDSGLESAYSRFNIFWGRFSEEYKERIEGAGYGELKAWIDETKDRLSPPRT